MKNANAKTTESYKALCFNHFVESDTENEPELATNDEWRGIMARARKDHGMSQEDLGQKVGSSQAMISKIESGESGSSKLVRPICVLLNIPLPEHFTDEAERAWVQAGRVLRHRNPEQAKATLALVESMAKQYEDAEQPAEPEPPRNGNRPRRS